MTESVSIHIDRQRDSRCYIDNSDSVSLAPSLVIIFAYRRYLCGSRMKL